MFHYQPLLSSQPSSSPIGISHFVENICSTVARIADNNFDKILHLFVGRLIYSLNDQNFYFKKESKLTDVRTPAMKDKVKVLIEIYCDSTLFLESDKFSSLHLLTHVMFARTFASQSGKSHNSFVMTRFLNDDYVRMCN